jgi:indolepyruvate ferredoxin oxidoreductase alpha subunit
MQGGMYNTVLRALSQLGFADVFGNSKIPLFVLNVTYPLVPEEISTFCAGKKAVLIVEEGQPDYLEQTINTILRRADISTKVIGKDVLPMAGEYTPEVILTGIKEFFRAHAPQGVDVTALVSQVEQLVSVKKQATELLGAPVPTRPPTFCTGCPERPVFSAMKIIQQELGPTHVSADIGCHSFATLAPFNVGNTIMGYGLGLASSSGVAPAFGKRVVSIMGDGGFWHNGLSSGVTGALFNNDDSILVVMKNGYSAATGWQYLPSSRTSYQGKPAGMSIEKVLKNLGVKWLKRIRSYNVATMAKALREAMTTKKGGLKVIVADGECQLARQRRVGPEKAAKSAAGQRVVYERFGVDDDVCTGDHSCIRLSGCPSLTIKDNPDPLRTDPVAHVNQGCVGCGLCGEVAHAARLCPSFYRAEIVHNPTRFDRFLNELRYSIIHALQARHQVPSPFGRGTG